MCAPVRRGRRTELCVWQRESGAAGLNDATCASMAFTVPGMEHVIRAARCADGHAAVASGAYLCSARRLNKNIEGAR